MITIRPARGDDDLAAVRQLCWAYRDVLVARTTDFPLLLDFFYAQPVYQQLMDDLPARHIAPDGEIFVAEMQDQIVACGMTHRIDATTCEIKRVFVAPAARGQGIAQQLCKAAMQDARERGYTRVVLDTMRNLPEAMALYEGMGFTEAVPYYDLPDTLLDDIVFYEHPL
ncbi:GNAT family N-acetyltransferase [Cognatiyoonia sp. IB215446]|uniref:GNAT family N-acetyltransferase n=1 Tax=Cognatiyoonia sp. IB215446 TaxID=3097355 RepID=UPI002A0DFC2E|nr:GNAT family N-acetyltransferase [Cognatiyoonia sp. IB215446]MDX8348756.1 GNAT family N-acetyltransferase [Cognatiyoonia sp. IB215446]